MVDPLYIFLFAGQVSMSAALSAGALNKLPPEQRPAFSNSRNGALAVVLAGNLGAITFLAAMVFGVLKLIWWIPLACMFISFPALHLILFQRLLGDVKNLGLMTVLSVVAVAALYYYW